LGLYKNLFKQTVIYGLATVIPRMFSFLLVPLYTDLLPTAEYGKVSIIFAYMIFFNVILAYGMETAFFRFYNKEEDKKLVVETTMVSIFWTSICFLFLGLLYRNTLSQWSGIDSQYITYTIWILVLDALVIIPFSKLRAYQKPMVYSAIKIGNVIVNLSLSVFFLIYLPQIAQSNPDSFLGSLFILIPNAATAPVLILLGVFMISGIRNINFEDFSEGLPAFLTIIIMPFTYSIINGISAGIVFYILLKLVIGKWREIHWMMYVLMLLIVLRFGYFS